MEELAKGFDKIIDKKIEIYAQSIENNGIGSKTHKQVKENLAIEAGEEFKKIFLKIFNIADALYENL
jgi:hypothetical protein